MKVSLIYIENCHGHFDPLPFKLGYNFVGRVVAAGENVTKVAVGDLVCYMGMNPLTSCIGSYATQVRIDASKVRRIPPANPSTFALLPATLRVGYVAENMVLRALHREFDAPDGALNREGKIKNNCLSVLVNKLGTCPYAPFIVKLFKIYSPNTTVYATLDFGVDSERVSRELGCVVIDSFGEEPGFNKSFHAIFDNQGDVTFEACMLSLSIGGLMICYKNQGSKARRFNPARHKLPVKVGAMPFVLLRIQLPDNKDFDRGAKGLVKLLEQGRLTMPHREFPLTVDGVREAHLCKRYEGAAPGELGLMRGRSSYRGMGLVLPVIRPTMAPMAE